MKAISAKLSMLSKEWFFIYEPIINRTRETVGIKETPLLTRKARKHDDKQLFIRSDCLVQTVRNDLP